MERYYWTGSASKARIAGQVIELARRAGPLTVLDLGCGDGGDWPAVLADHPMIHLVAVEPDGRRASVARQRLPRGRADVVVGDQPPSGVQADVVVSLSVLEHVWDRAAYLSTARDAMAPDALFFLAYDDGHFRGGFTFDRPSTWWFEAKVALLNLLAPLMARLGRHARYQARVDRETIDALIAAAGLRIENEYYANLSSMKSLAKSIPDQERGDFMKLWLETESRLNERFLRELQEKRRGDERNLWWEMPTRVLVLRRGEG